MARLGARVDDVRTCVGAMPFVCACFDMVSKWFRNGSQWSRDGFEIVANWSQNDFELVSKCFRNAFGMFSK